MNIRLCTVLIINRGAEYLVGRIPYSMELRWSRSPYDAWRTRKKETAQAVADVCAVCLAIPLAASELRKMK